MKTSIVKHTAIAAITAAAVLGASVQSSSALPLDASTFTAQPSVQLVGWDINKDEAAALGAVGGFLLGAAVVGAHHKKKKKQAWNQHVAFCLGKWNTYNPNTNMYMSPTGWKICASPFM